MIMTTIVTWIVTVMVTVVVCSISSINSLSWVSFEHFKAIRWVDFPISQIVRNTCHRVLGISTCVYVYIYIYTYVVSGTGGTCMITDCSQSCGLQLGGGDQWLS